MLQFCRMDEKHLTPLEAFQHFLKNYTGKKGSDIYEAVYAMQGRRTHGLGVRRIRSLLEKYAPGVYEFHAGEPYFVKK